MTTETESLGIIVNLVMLIETFRTVVMETIESDDRRNVNLDDDDDRDEPHDGLPAHLLRTGAWAR